MRRALLLLLAALALTAAGPTGSDRYHRRPCTWHGSKTIYRDHDVRVFKHHSIKHEEVRTYACLLRANKRHRIADCPPDVDGICGEVGAIVVKAPWIGFSRFDSSKGYEQHLVFVLNLATGHGRGAATFGAWDLGITRGGSLAWVAADEASATVYAIPADEGRSVVLDSGPGVDRSSLAVGDTHVYWTHDGEPRSATMP